MAAAAVAATVVATNGMGTPAYAVATEPDGMVSVTVNRADDPASANRELRGTSDRVVIMRPSAAEDCPVADRGTSYTIPVGVDVVVADYGKIVRFRPESVPAGAILVIEPLETADGQLTRMGFGLYRAPGPKCVIASFPS